MRISQLIFKLSVSVRLIYLVIKMAKCTVNVVAKYIVGQKYQWPDVRYEDMKVAKCTIG